MMGPLHPPHERPLVRIGLEEEGGEGRPRLDPGPRPDPECEGDNSCIWVCRDPKLPCDGPGLCGLPESETEIFGGEKAIEGELAADIGTGGVPRSETVTLGAEVIEIAGVPAIATAETETLGPFPGSETTILGPNASLSSISLSLL